MTEKPLTTIKRILRKYHDNESYNKYILPDGTLIKSFENHDYLTSEIGEILNIKYKPDYNILLDHGVIRITHHLETVAFEGLFPTSKQKEKILDVISERKGTTDILLALGGLKDGKFNSRNFLYTEEDKNMHDSLSKWLEKKTGMSVL